MGRKIDLTGQRFGKWTVLREAEKRSKRDNTRWECLCDCGTKRTVSGATMRSGRSSSCGCVRKPDITGQIFGRWRVISKSSRTDVNHTSFWNCVCNCGTHTEVSSANLISGNSKSCGCLKGELSKSRMVGMYGNKHPAFNPKISDKERHRNRYQLHGDNMTSWRTSVYSVNSYTCQGCGDNSGGNLNAHHLNGWNAFPEQRFDTANGITLCEDCHKEYHHFNGYGDNTLEEFRDHIACIVGEEYISEIEETLLSRESEIIGQEEIEQKETRELQTI